MQGVNPAWWLDHQRYHPRAVERQDHDAEMAHIRQLQDRPTMAQREASGTKETP